MIIGSCMPREELVLRWLRPEAQRSLHNDCLHREKISWHVLDEDISENDIRLFEKMVTNVGRTSYLKLDKMQNQKNERYYSYMEGKRQ